MPKIRPGMRRPPPGFELINDKLDEYDAEMRLVLSDDPQQAQLPTCGSGAKRSGVASGSTEKIAEDGNGTKKAEVVDLEKPVPPLWRVARINRERTRYVFSACYLEKAISNEVLNYCCEMNFIDAGLVRRWKLPGYERLCCTACCIPGTASASARMVSKHTNRNKPGRREGNSGEARVEGTCICRVPAEQRRMKRLEGCTVCGCTGCGSGGKRRRDPMEEQGEAAPSKVARRCEGESVQY
ncbi:putative G10 protein [Trypanosoma rangeli]|uniref:Putative G10 protein n=1 Tax=Trypanosoma rangeli TaxID=5698 RepID=A0A422NIY1_TRYRA|nr:putative G10 protein [Trypanosoma rangeli]RNF05421.1 putative G10 protein [Trypanosoma rangeli]|eukprot:RNF05421.1 putative G10 protein [Trypanosoma rangeli]